MKPCDFENYRKAWMTRDVFKKWLVNLDGKFERKKRKVLLFQDNCTANGKKDRSCVLSTQQDNTQSPLSLFFWLAFWSSVRFSLFG